jgi:hypothetical protein
MQSLPLQSILTEMRSNASSRHPTPTTYSQSFLRVVSSCLTLLFVQVGKIDAKKHLQQDIETVMSNNIIQCLGTMLDTVVF